MSIRWETSIDGGVTARRFIFEHLPPFEEFVQKSVRANADSIGVCLHVAPTEPFATSRTGEFVDMSDDTAVRAAMSAAYFDLARQLHRRAELLMHAAEAEIARLTLLLATR